MGATRDGTAYVAILDCPEDGTVWLQVQLPIGPLTRGPYETPEEAQRAASSLERVACRRWAQRASEARLTGGEIGNPAPWPSRTAGQAEESAEETPFTMKSREFTVSWPISCPRRLDFVRHESDVYTHGVRTYTGAMNNNRNGHHDTNLEALIDLYLVRCQVEGKSPNTVTAYAETLKLFRRIAAEEGFPPNARAITPGHMYTYLGRIAETGVSLATRHRRHREVRFLFSWLERMDYIKENPFARIKNVRLPQKIVEPFSPEEVARILAVCDPATELGARDRAIVLLFLDSGLRLNELVQLDLADVDFESQRIRVRHGKGNKQRVVAFGGQAGDALLHYVQNLRGTQQGQIFRAVRAGRPLSRNLVRVRMQRLGQMAGVPKTHAHRFRHTFATWAIENGARELDVQYLLGHSTPTMVRRYSATYNAEKAARTHVNWSPGDLLARSLDGRRTSEDGYSPNPGQSRPILAAGS